MFSAGVHHVHHHHWLSLANVPAAHVVPAKKPTPTPTPTPTPNPTPTGDTPAQIRHAYGFDQITFTDPTGATIAGDGSGQTIAIVDATDDTYIASDLATFDQQFGLPAMDGLNGDPTFTVVKQPNSSTTKMTTNNASWAVEIALDVQWAHAIAPKANIVLYESLDTLNTDMYTMVDQARSNPAVSAISMSWDSTDKSIDASLDYHFTSPSGHIPITFVAASGDFGAPVGYPAASPNVVSVGGTQLTTDTLGNYVSETGWSGSGGGVSPYEPVPDYQSRLGLGFTGRAAPDVSYNGAQPSHVSVYDSVVTTNNTVGWINVYGTSAGTPQWAALVAIADQGRALAAKPTLGSEDTLRLLYSSPPSDFHDILTGTSTGTPNYTAGPGYDLVTGIGTPVANALVQDLLKDPPAVF
jgi:subtilase family serine protease